MQSEELTFTREEFYEKVWSMPATKLGAELGISDVMVGKICKEYGIPKPYLGYWAKLQHGKKPKRTPLPKTTEPTLETLTFYKHQAQPAADTTPAPEPVYDPDIEQLLQKARSLKPITVPKSLSRPHPLVAATSEYLKWNRLPYDRRPNRPARQPTLSVDVSKECESRALRIMDALIKRVERIGGSVEVRQEDWRRETIVVFGGETVSVLRLREKQNQVRVRPGDEDYGWKRIVLKPSGLLILDTDRHLGTTILLQDTPKRRRIEEDLNDLIIGFVQKAGRLRIKRREDEAARKRWAEEERVRLQKEEELRLRREKLQQAQQAERRRVDELVDHANSWRQSRVIREYLREVCDLLLERYGSIDVESEAADYLRWAHQQADRLDPLRPSQPSVLDERL